MNLKCTGEHLKRARHLMCALLLCSITLSGCALFGPTDTIPLKEATAEQLSALLQEQAEEVRTIKGLFTAKITGGILPIGQRVQGTVFYQRPNAIRLRGFSAVGSEIFEFVQIEDQFKLRLPTMGREVIGRPSEADQLGQLTRPFQLSVWAMSGITGTQVVGPREQVRLSEDGTRYRLDVVAAPGTNGAAPFVSRRIWFDRRNLLVVQEERLTPAGEVEATMQFDDYRAVGSLPSATPASSGQSPEVGTRIMRPFTIRMTDGQGSGSLQVTFHELVPNEPIKPGELGRV
jgi:outer membrane lipoprotein-sorting protein